MRVRSLANKNMAPASTVKLPLDSVAARLVDAANDFLSGNLSKWAALGATFARFCELRQDE